MYIALNYCGAYKRKMLIRGIKLKKARSKNRDAQAHLDHCTDARLHYSCMGKVNFDLSLVVSIIVPCYC